MIKWLVLIVCGWALFKLITNDSKKKSEATQQKKERKVAKGDMVKDPVCGAYVELDQQIRVRQGETIHRFCSYECRDKFLQQLEERKQVAEKPSPEAPQSKESPDDDSQKGVKVEQAESADEKTA